MKIHQNSKPGLQFQDVNAGAVFSYSTEFYVKLTSASGPVNAVRLRDGSHAVFKSDNVVRLCPNAELHIGEY